MVAVLVEAQAAVVQEVEMTVAEAVAELAAIQAETRAIREDLETQVLAMLAMAAVTLILVIVMMIRNRG